MTLTIGPRCIGGSAYGWAVDPVTPPKADQGPLSLVWPDIKSKRFDVTIGHSSFDVGVIADRCAQDQAKGRRTNLRLHPHYTDDGSKVPCDKDIADGKLDSKLIALANVCEAAGNVDLTFAPEVNGSWNHHTPYTLPLAWRRLGDRMDTSKVPMGFCYEPSAPYDLFDGISNKNKGMGKWWPGVKYVQRFELDPYTLEEMSGPLTVDHGFVVILTPHGRSVSFLAAGTKLGLPKAITEMGCSDKDVTPEYIDAWFDFAQANGIGLMVVNHINYKTGQFQGTSWAKGWCDGRIDNKPACVARFKALAQAWVASV